VSNVQHKTDRPDAEEELTRLRNEVAELRSQLAAQPVAPTATTPGPVREARQGWWRPVVVTVLVLVAGILAPASIVATWAKDEVADTDRYVQTIAPLASDPAVQRAIVDRVTSELFSRINVQAVTQDAINALESQGLPPRVSQSLGALSAPLADGVRSFITDQVTKLVESNAFADAWVSANRAAHTQMVAVLTGEGSKQISVQGGTVSINLAAIINTVKNRLSSAGFGLAERIPTVNAQFTVFESADIPKAQSAFRALEALARWLPVLALLLLAAAVYVGRNRRKTLIVCALTVAGSMVLLGAALNILRPIYLDQLDPNVLPRDAGAAIYDQLVGFIRLNLRAVLVVALVVAIAGWLTGPGGAATRRALSGGIGWLRGGAEHAGLDTGPVGSFVYTWRTVIRWAIAGVAVLVYLLQDHPTGRSALSVLIYTVLALVIVEFLARPPSPEPALIGAETADTESEQTVKLPEQARGDRAPVSSGGDDERPARHV
jgi:hypothetical protein